MAANDSHTGGNLIMPSTIENIDAAMLAFLTDELNISTQTNKGFKKIPIIWVAAERAAQIKQHKDLRDAEGALIYPVMTLERASIIKDLSNKGSIFGNIPPVNDPRRGSYTVARKIQQQKSAEFTNASSKRTYDQINFKVKKQDKRTVYETYTIPLPIYVTVNYTVSITTEYQQQMNDAIAPFLTRPGGINYFSLSNEGHSYEGFIDSDFTSNNTVSNLEENERKFVTDINIRVLGYVIGEGINQETPKIVKRESAVEIRFPREQVVFGDIPTHIDDKGFYRS
jgi:hypothetical protein